MIPPVPAGLLYLYKNGRLNIMENYFDKALSLMHEGNYDEAASDFDRCIKYEPYNSEALFYQAVCFRKMGYESLALENINKALGLSPADTEYLFERALILDSSYERQDEALEDIEKVLKTEVMNSKAYKVSADIYLKKNDYDTALERFSKALECCTDEVVKADLLVMRGYCYMMKGKYSEAEIDFLEAEERKTGDYFFHHQRGYLYRREEKFAEAAAEFKKAIKAEPSNSQVYAELAEVYLIIGNTDEALWASSSAAGINSENKLSAYVYILAYELCGIKKGQLPLFKYTEVYQFPEDLEFHKMRAYICYRNGLFGEAIYSIKRVIALDKDPQGFYYFNMGLCYSLLGDVVKTNNCMIIANSLSFESALEVLQENFLIN